MLYRKTAGRFLANAQSPNEKQVSLQTQILCLRRSAQLFSMLHSIDLKRKKHCFAVCCFVCQLCNLTAKKLLNVTELTDTDVTRTKGCKILLFSFFFFSVQNWLLQGYWKKSHFNPGRQKSSSKRTLPPKKICYSKMCFGCKEARL